MMNLADFDQVRSERPPLAVPPATMAGVYLCRRYPINSQLADLVASLAGLGPNQGLAS
jgi:hypothetical protein